LNISREGDSTTSLGSLFQGSITLRGKKFFLMFRWNFLICCSGLGYKQLYKDSYCMTGFPNVFQNSSVSRRTSLCFPVCLPTATEPAPLRWSSLCAWTARRRATQTRLTGRHICLWHLVLLKIASQFPS